MAIPPPAPQPHPLWQNFPMCPVTGLSEDGSHGTTSRRTWVKKKSLQSSTTGTLPEKVVWQGPTDALARSRSLSSEEIFSGPKYDENATPIGSANTRNHFGLCNSLRCEMAPWRDWTSLTYICMAAAAALMCPIPPEAGHYRDKSADPMDARMHPKGVRGPCCVR